MTAAYTFDVFPVSTDSAPPAVNRALMAAGLVGRVQVTIFPVITGQSGVDPILQGAADFDLEQVETKTLDGHIQELARTMRERLCACS